MILMTCFLLFPAWGQLYEDFIDQGFDALEGRNPRGAELSFKKALQSRPKDAEATCYLGLALYKQGEYIAALEKFEQAIVLDRTLLDAPLYYYRALCIRQLGLANAERKAWQEIIAYAPSSRFAQKAREALAGMGGRPKYAPVGTWIKGTEVGQFYPHSAILFYIEEVESILDPTTGRRIGEITAPLSNLLNTLNRTGQPNEVVDFEGVVDVIGPVPPSIFLDLAIARVITGQCETADNYLRRVPLGSFPRRKDNIQTICNRVRKTYMQQISRDGSNFRLNNYNPLLHDNLIQQGVPLIPAPRAGATQFGTPVQGGTR